MKRYKRKFIDNFEIDKDYIKKIKESSVSFTSADDARDAIANIIYLKNPTKTLNLSFYVNVKV